MGTLACEMDSILAARPVSLFWFKNKFDSLLCYNTVHYKKWCPHFMSIHMISIKSRNQDPTQISTLLYCEIFQTLIATYTWQNQPQNQEIVNSQYFDSFALRLLSILLRSARPIVSIVRSSKFAWLSPNLASLCCSRILIVSVTNCLFLCHLHCIKSRRKCNSVVCWRFLGLAISASSRAGSVSLPEGSSRELAPCSFCMDATFWNFGQKIATKSGISQKWD